MKQYLMHLMMTTFLVSSLGFASSSPLTFEKTQIQKKFATGFKLEKNWQKKVTTKEVKIQAALPRHFDWREQVKGGLTPVLNQGDCGSCWAVSGVTQFQDILLIAGQGRISLSPQYLLSCNKEGWSCDGGFFAHDYHMALPMGGVPEAEFPYVAKKVACKSGLSHPYHLASWAYLPSSNDNTPPSVDAIKNAIYQYGPISAGVGASDAFMSYTSGVFNQCDSTKPNHAINIVGWDDDGQYWIMRNSWSSQWGDNGFMKIRYGCNKIGIAANYVVFTSPNPNPNPTPDPVPVCTPVPYANAGRDMRIFRGMLVRLGTPARPDTTYHWESSVPGRFPEAAQIAVRPMSTRTYTVFATTKCGTTKSTVIITVN